MKTAPRLRQFNVRSGWQPGDLGWVIGEHGRYYAREWQLGAGFEAKVAEAMGAWMARFDPAHDLFLMAEDEAGPLGSISLDGSGPHVAAEGARLRFFIMADRARGMGLGHLLMGETMAFIRKAGFDTTTVVTVTNTKAMAAVKPLPGKEVAAGDLVVVLEAMKMENPVTAHKDGVITGLSAEAGSAITQGTVLCEIK